MKRENKNINIKLKQFQSVKKERKKRKKVPVINDNRYTRTVHTVENMKVIDR